MERTETPLPQPTPAPAPARRSARRSAPPASAAPAAPAASGEPAGESQPGQPPRLDLSRMEPPRRLAEARLEEVTIDGICGVY
jgi:mycofactocin precursor